MTSPKAARTDHNGTRHYPIPHPETKQQHILPSVTNLIKLKSAEGLNIWKQTTIAKWFNQRPDLVALAGINPREAISQALDCETAKRNVGTAVHGYTEAADDGTLNIDLVPPGAQQHLTQYLHAKAVHKWTVVAAEQTIYNHTIGYAGSFDRILHIHDIDGCLVSDTKTGALFPELALQLAFYAHGEGIWDATTETHQPMPDGLRTDIGLVVHLRETSCDLRVVDLTGAWEACQGLVELWKWQQDHGTVTKTIAKPIKPPTPTLREKIVNELRQLDATVLTQVAAHWPEGVPSLKASDGHTDEQLERIAVVIAAVTSANNVPFTETIEEQQRPPVIDRAAPMDPAKFMDLPATTQAKQRCIDRLSALDSDLLETVTGNAKVAAIPNLKSDQIINAHIDILDYYLTEAETAQAARRQADVFVQ